MQIKSLLAITGRVRLSGGCLQMLDVLRGLHHRGCNVGLICRDIPEAIGGREIPFRVVTWQQVGRLSALRNEESFRHLFGQPLAERVHIYGTELGRMGNRLIRDLPAPAVFTPLNAEDETGDVARIQRRCAGVIALSQSMREALVNRARVPREKVSVVTPGVELQLCGKAQEVCGNRISVVGMAEPLASNRGQRLFLEMARQTLAAGRDAEFVMAGDGPEEKRLRKYAEKLGLLKQVTFATRLTHYRNAILALDVFVRPGSDATVGSSVLEAMSAGKPVVATAAAGVVEIVENGVTGFLVEKNNGAALADAVGRLIDDPALARRMGAAARARVAAHYDMASVVEKTLAVYEKVTETEGGKFGE